MASELYRAGQRVTHPKFGEGTVKAVSPDGESLRVFFTSINTSVLGVHPSSLVRLGPVVPSAPLGSGGSAGPSDRLAPAPISAEVVLDRASSARMTLECLRQGLPPRNHVTTWTVGNLHARESLKKAILRAAQKGRGTVLLASAAYGQGKSHFGRLAMEQGWASGLASFNAELDGDGVSLAQGSRLVATLFASLRLPATGQNKDYLSQGLGPLLKQASVKSRGTLRPILKPLEPFLKEPSLWTGSDEIIEAIECYISGDRSLTLSQRLLTELLGTRLRLESFKMNWGSNQDRQQQQLTQLSRVLELTKLAECKGAVIVLDELDHDLRSDCSRQYSMLEAMRDMSMSSPVVLVLLARNLDLSGAEEIQLNELSTPDYLRLVERTIEAFAAVHPLPGLSKGQEKLFAKLNALFIRKYKPLGWGPRFFVRAAIESCEVLRHREHQSLAEVSV